MNSNQINLPRYLYKYSKLDKRFISGLINHELWFANPTSFNDPYDCKLALDTDNSNEEIKSHLEKVNKLHTDYFKKIKDPIKQLNFLRTYYDNKTQDELYKILSDIFSGTRMISSEELIEKRIVEISKNKQILDEVINNNAQAEVKNYRILCLTKELNSVVMWAHYTDNHSGVCLKFDTMKDKQFFTFHIKVNYVREYPRFNYIKEYDKHNTINYIYGTKHLSWKYEKEYRIVKYIPTTKFRNSGLLGYGKPVLKAIYFGINSNIEDIELVLKINKEYFGDNLKLFQAKEKQRSFKFEYEKIN